MIDIPSDATPPPADMANGRPRRRVAVVTCMDARIDPIAVLGLDLGDAIVIRNAGARVTADVLRSLALAVRALGVQEVVVMEHTMCGLTGTTDDQLRALTGADIEFLAIASHADALRADLDILVATRYLSDVTVFAGLLYDTHTGRVDAIDERRAAGDG